MTLVCSKFKLIEKLGAGAFGEVYKAENVYNNESLAIKIEVKESKHNQLQNEYYIYRLLAGSEGIPYIRYFGKEDGQNTMAMELLGKSLDELFTERNDKFSLKTTLMIADQMISRLEYLHNKNLIHRDIKPKNFTIGRGNNANQIYIIDMGLAKRYCDPRNHIHIKLGVQKSLIGTAKYTSLATHLGFDQSRRDDLEGVAYTLIHFLRGDLPWQTLKNKTKKEKLIEIHELKTQTTVDELCEGLPSEFATFLDRVRKLEFDERPDYSGYRQLFRDLFIKEGYVYDFVFDWCAEKRKEVTKHVIGLAEPVSIHDSVYRSLRHSRPALQGKKIISASQNLLQAFKSRPQTSQKLRVLGKDLIKPQPGRGSIMQM